LVSSDFILVTGQCVVYFLYAEVITQYNVKEKKNVKKKITQYFKGYGV
jgi:hypothetical protein